MSIAVVISVFQPFRTTPEVGVISVVSASEPCGSNKSSRRPSQEEEEGLDVSLHQATIMYDKQNPFNLHDVPAGYFAAYYYKDLMVVYNNLVWLWGVSLWTITCVSQIHATAFLVSSCA